MFRASFHYKRKVKERLWDTSNTWLKFAQLEGIFFKTNYQIRGQLLKISALLPLGVWTFTMYCQGWKQKNIWAESNNGILVGDKGDIERKKILSNVALSNNDRAWKKKWKTKLRKRLRLYQTFVNIILLHNSGTWPWPCPKTFRKNWSDSVTTKDYSQKTVPLSITITERRWKFLRHILKKNNEILFLKNIHQKV